MNKKEIRNQLAVAEYESFLSKAVLVHHIEGLIEEKEDEMPFMDIYLEKPLSVVVLATEWGDVLRWGGYEDTWLDPVFKVRLNECVCPGCCQEKGFPLDLMDLKDTTINGTAYCLDGRVDRSDVVGLDPGGRRWWPVQSEFSHK